MEDQSERAIEVMRHIAKVFRETGRFISFEEACLQVYPNRIVIPRPLDYGNQIHQIAQDRINEVLNGTFTEEDFREFIDTTSSSYELTSSREIISVGTGGWYNNTSSALWYDVGPASTISTPLMRIVNPTGSTVTVRTSSGDEYTVESGTHNVYTVDVPPCIVNEPSPQEQEIAIQTRFNEVDENGIRDGLYYPSLNELYPGYKCYVKDKQGNYPLGSGKITLTRLDLLQFEEDWDNYKLYLNSYIDSNIFSDMGWRMFHQTFGTTVNNDVDDTDLLYYIKNNFGVEYNDEERIITIYKLDENKRASKVVINDVTVNNENDFTQLVKIIERK